MIKRAYPFLSTGRYLMVLRIVLGLYMMAHGAARIYMNSLAGFGDFLDSKGLPAGFILAWTVTVFDIVGGALFVLGFLKKVISAVFIFVLLMGIVLVHGQNGWFTVGHQTGGIEYSVLLIICFLTVASTEQ